MHEPRVISVSRTQPLCLDTDQDAPDDPLVEDGIMTAAGVAERYGGGPHAPIMQFLRERPGRYEIDSRYCNWFGLNVTWNVNGFLRRTR
jgi:cephalosporin hydroxylase